MTKAVATRPIDRFKTVINQPTVQEQFRNALDKHSDLFVASLIDLYSSGLQDCEPAAVIQEALKAATLRLPVSKGLGWAYIVPYNKKYKEGGQWKSKKIPQFQLGYKGMIQLAMRSGQLKHLNPDKIYEGESVEYDRMSGELKISGNPTSDKAIGYFVYMELLNGFKKTEYWSKEKVIRHAEKKSVAYQSDKYKKGAWFTDEDAMSIKTVLRSILSKYAPMSIEFLTGFSGDEMGESEEKTVSLEVSESEEQRRDFEEKPDKQINQSDDAPEQEPEIGDPFGEEA